MELHDRASRQERRQHLRNALSNAKSHRASSLFVGTALCLFGVLILLQNMGVLRIRDGLAWVVPAAAIAWGIYMLIQVKAPFGRAMAAIAIIFGVLRFLHLGGVIEFDRRYIPPMIMIGVGAAFLLRAVSPQKQPKMSDLSDGFVAHNVVFGGVEKRIECPDFRGGELFVCFGGIDLDFRKSKIVPGQTVTLDCNVIFGGLNLRVPEEWRVDVRTTNIFGGVDDKSVNMSERTDLPILVLEGSMMFGGAEIRN